MKKALLSVLLVLALLAFAGCGQTSADTADAETAEPAAAATDAQEPEITAEASQETEAGAESLLEAELTIAAAASMTDVTAAIKAAYEELYPNITLTFTYASSGALQTQIEQGAPVDIFISAAQKQMIALQEQELLLDDAYKDLLKNNVVLIIPADSEKEIASFEDLASETVEMFAMGNPESVPAGQYAQELLTSMGIYEQIESKANFGTDVRQVLTWVESGEVDCGIVYSTDAATSDSVTIVSSSSGSDVINIIYPAAVLKSSEYPGQAQDFIDYLATEECAEIFDSFGFEVIE